MHRFDFTVRRTTDDDIADLKRSALDHDLGHDTAVGLLLGLETSSERRSRSGLALNSCKFCGHQNRFEQFVESRHR